MNTQTPQELDVKRELKKYHTKQLIKILNVARACGGYYSPYDDNSNGFTFDQIKDELATREHVPNKIEAKRIRQELARKKK